MGITEVTVPKQYVLVQTTEPTGAFEGQLWYNSSEDLTYIFQDDDWQLITLDISQEVLDLATENAKQQIDIIELQANASVTPIDHDTLISDTFIDADGYKDSVNTGNTTATFDANKYQRNNTGGITGLNAYYNFDETSGTTLIDEVNAYNGTNTGCTVNQAGKLNTSYLFTGSSYITLSSSLTDNVSVIDIGAGNSAPDKLGVYVTTWKASTNSIEVDVWTHVAVTYDGTNIRIYLNGALDSTHAVTVAKVFSYSVWIKPNAIGTKKTIYAIDSSTHLLGQRGGGTARYSGYMDELSIWDRVLTLEEIGKIYNSGDGLPYTAGGYLTPPTIEDKILEIDLPTIAGTVTTSQLVTNSQIETGASISYKLNNGTDDDTEEIINTKNTYNLTGAPTKLKILLNAKPTTGTSGNPSITSYCLKLWKA